MSMVTVAAHFDGEHIRLDEPLEMDANTRLLITILPEQHDEERAAWMRLSMDGLAGAYGADEVDYSLDGIREANPVNEGR